MSLRNTKGFAWWLCGWACAWPLHAQVPVPGPVVVAADSAPISLNFQNIEVRALMQVFADFTGLNFVTTDSVAGQVSVRLHQVPWPQALQVVLQAKGLAARQEGRVVWIAPQDEWSQREKKSQEAQAALDAVNPLQMLSMHLASAAPPRWPVHIAGASTTSAKGSPHRAPPGLPAISFHAATIRPVAQSRPHGLPDARPGPWLATPPAAPEARAPGANAPTPGPPRCRWSQSSDR